MIADRSGGALGSHAGREHRGAHAFRHGFRSACPQGRRTGRKLRLKGRGIPGDPPGDLYLQLELVLPPDSDKARELFGTMAREFAFDPRQSMKG